MRGSLFFLNGIGMFVLPPLLIWIFVWKGLALWRAARNGDKVWFIALLLLNTLGILEIIYYFLMGKSKNENSPE